MLNNLENPLLQPQKQSSSIGESVSLIGIAHAQFEADMQSALMKMSVSDSGIEPLVSQVQQKQLLEPVQQNHFVEQISRTLQRLVAIQNYSPAPGLGPFHQIQDLLQTLVGLVEGYGNEAAIDALALFYHQLPLDSPFREHIQTPLSRLVDEDVFHFDAQKPFDAAFSFEARQSKTALLQARIVEMMTQSSAVGPNAQAQLLERLQSLQNKALSDLGDSGGFPSSGMMGASAFLGA